jgi:hypothetical protein
MPEVKDIKDVTFCVVDRGTFFPIAQRLARQAKKVFYNRPQGESFTTFAQYALGDGHEDVEFTADFWKHKKEIDTFVFPDSNDSDEGLQIELEGQGFGVWGSKLASSLEQMRGQWIRKCEELGLPMPNTKTVKGLTKLRLYLDQHQGEKLFVKISRFRGDMETWETKDSNQVRNKLDYLSLRFGPFQEVITFYVQEAVETDIEGGSDTYNVFGQYPDEVVLGFEKKAESYFGVVKKRSEMAPEIWAPSESLVETLRESRYANLISSEVRVKGKKSYWLDPCLRTPSPAGEEELELYSNFAEIVYRGSFGELVQPEWTAKFCGEAVIEYCGDRDTWKSICVPEEVRRWVKLYACGYEDGAYHFPPAQDPEAIGCAVALGDTPDEVLDRLKEIREALKGASVDMHIEPIADLFSEIEDAKEEGIEFSSTAMPEPAEVLKP